MLKEPAKVQPYNMKELCKLYRVSDKTMRKWLNEIKGDLGEKVGRLYNVNQVKTIFEKLGRPESDGVGM